MQTKAKMLRKFDKKFFIDFQKKLKKNFNKNKAIWIFSISAVLSITLVVIIALSLTPPKVEIIESVDERSALERLNNAEKINISVLENRFSPGKVKIKKGEFYDFTFIRDRNANCAGLRIRTLDIRIDLQVTQRTLPFRINSSGTYELECVNEDFKMNIIVE